MFVELSLLGIVIGALSGFFGIGGGTVLVPVLLLLGFDMKHAVGISIMQMVFSSIYGSYLNVKKGSLKLGEGLYVGLGGALGGYLSGYVVQYVSDIVLQSVFVGFVVFAIYRMATGKQHTEHTAEHDLPAALLFGIGVGIGLIAISIGVGGAIILIPLLSGLLHYPVKKAVSAGLFFVVFSSIAGFIGRWMHGEIDLHNGAVVGIASLLGVYIGIHLKDRVSSHHHTRFIVVMYSFILAIMLYKMFS
ncbi:MAG: sulfite exporter TauE/SafE family protein [Sulfurovum sp.]|nr:sulfite exporter TauE/SafE family protein [Sulfurovum sp.]